MSTVVGQLFQSSCSDNLPSTQRDCDPSVSTQNWRALESFRLRANFGGARPYYTLEQKVYTRDKTNASKPTATCLQMLEIAYGLNLKPPQGHSVENGRGQVVYTQKNTQLNEPRLGGSKIDGIKHRYQFNQSACCKSSIDEIYK